MSALAQDIVPLNPDDRAALDAIMTRATPAQRQWLGGYVAGWQAAAAPALLVIPIRMFIPDEAAPADVKPEPAAEKAPEPVKAAAPAPRPEAAPAAPAGQSPMGDDPQGIATTQSMQLWHQTATRSPFCKPAPIRAAAARIIRVWSSLKVTERSGSVMAGRSCP